jgi:hypothetical protein
VTMRLQCRTYVSLSFAEIKGLCMPLRKLGSYV